MGQAIHLRDGSFAYLQSRPPHCFKGRTVIAHLFDQDPNRLLATVKSLACAYHKRFRGQLARVE